MAVQILDHASYFDVAGLADQEDVAALGPELLGRVVCSTHQRTRRVNQRLVHAPESSMLRIADAVCCDQHERGRDGRMAGILGRLVKASLVQLPRDAGVVDHFAVDGDLGWGRHGLGGLQRVSDAEAHPHRLRSNDLHGRKHRPSSPESPHRNVSAA